MRTFLFLARAVKASLVEHMMFNVNVLPSFFRSSPETGGDDQRMKQNKILQWTSSPNGFIQIQFKKVFNKFIDDFTDLAMAKSKNGIKTHHKIVFWLCLVLCLLGSSSSYFSLLFRHFLFFNSIDFNQPAAPRIDFIHWTNFARCYIWTAQV